MSLNLSESEFFKFVYNLLKETLIFIALFIHAFKFKSGKNIYKIKKGDSNCSEPP